MYELSKDHEDFRKVVREFADARPSSRTSRSGTASTTSRPTSCRRWASSGLFGLVVPEEYGGSLEAATAAPSPASCIAIEELGRVDQSIGITLSAGVGLGINPILTYGSRGAEGALPARPRRRPRARGLRPHRAGCRQRRGCHAHQGGARRRREWVVDGAKAFITNSGTDITSVVTVTARTGTGDDGRPEISAIMIPSGTPGFTVEARLRQARLEHLRHPRPVLRRLPGARGPPARPARPRLPPVPQDPRRRPHRDQRARRWA